VPAAFGPSRAALREVLGRYLGVAAGSVELEIGEHDRPALAGTARNALDFNLSHSRASGLIVVGRSVRVGVDIECVDASRDTSGLAARFFSEAEREVVFSSADPVGTFYRFWTCKEAYLKAIGTGLSRSPRSFDVEIGAMGGRAVVIDPEIADSAGTVLCELQAGEGLAATVCVLGAALPIRIFDAAEWVA
jgi:4'-phosphopantetheinyl transferase